MGFSLDFIQFEEVVCVVVWFLVVCSIVSLGVQVCCCISVILIVVLGGLWFEYFFW